MLASNHNIIKVSSKRALGRLASEVELYLKVLLPIWLSPDRSINVTLEDDAEVSAVWDGPHHIVLKVPKASNPGEVAYFASDVVAKDRLQVGALTIHAVSARSRGQTIVIAAPRLAGKTTILSLLKSRGWVPIASNRLAVLCNEGQSMVVAATSVITRRAFASDRDRPLDLHYGEELTLPLAPQPVSQLICFAQSTEPLLIQRVDDGENRLLQLFSAMLGAPPIIGQILLLPPINWNAAWRNAQDLASALTITDAVGRIEDLAEAIDRGIG